MKKFNEEAFKACDAASRKAVIDYLTKKNFYVENRFDKYGIDLEFTYGQICGYIEIEVRQPWKEYYWPDPFNSIHIPFRKKKFLEIYNSFYFILPSTMDRAYITKAKRILESEIIIVSTTRCPEGEPFYNVPLNKFLFRDFK
jgi:hypothetical protein